MFKYLNKKLERSICNKINWFADKIYVEGYGQIISMKEEEIIINSFIINGSSLRITSFDGYLLEITGNIEKITRRESNEHLSSKNE